jgi:EpsI family protein
MNLGSPRTQATPAPPAANDAHAAPLPRRPLLAAALLLATLPAAEALRPRRLRAHERGALDPARDLPAAFGDWREDPAVRPLLPDPQTQAVLDATYTAVLARTLVRGQDGARVMLSVAYGEDQGSEATAVHRPEFCYRAQGFDVQSLGQHGLALAEGVPALTVARLFARIGPRQEPISYWLMLGGRPALPGIGRRIAQWREGLAGWIADGLIFRLSNFGPADARSFALHEDCARALFAATPQVLRPRYFGAVRPEVAS